MQPSTATTTTSRASVPGTTRPVERCSPAGKMIISLTNWKVTTVPSGAPLDPEVEVVFCCQLIKNIGYFVCVVEKGCYPRCPEDSPYYDENTGECTTLVQCTCSFNGTVTPPGAKIMLESIMW